LAVIGMLAALVFIVPTVAAAASAPVEGVAGIDAGLPATTSAVTVKGRGPFSDLKITVNQTRDLVNQVISVDWTGGVPTQTHSGPFTGKFDQNYLQMFECWGAPDGTNPQDPGPPPTQCEFGAQPEQGTSQGNTAAGLTSNGTPSTPTTGREVTVPSSLTYTDSSSCFYNWMPFDAVNGSVVPQQFNCTAQGGGSGNGLAYWLNPYFSAGSSNEVDFALTSANGTGSQSFTVDTGREAPGLGCGQAVEPQKTGPPTVPPCWLVIVPRGPATTEDGGLYCCGEPVMTSPMNPASWQNRIAIPLGFQPINNACSAFGATPIIGGELSFPAITNWTPHLCATPGAGSYGYTMVTDGQARNDLLTSGTGQPDMGVFDQPVDPSEVAPTNPLLYAPISLSGAVIAFNINRIPVDPGADPSEDQLQGTRLAHMYLTPRLVAKLLTESYRDEFFFPSAYVNPAAYKWDANNPQSLLGDPDFLEFNPEFRLLASDSQLWRAATLLVEQPNSDAAQTLWRWVLADPEAAAWLAGKPDPWGMVVNPYYDTSASANPEGVGFATPPPDSYPKSDPYCVQAQPPALAKFARELCIQDWDPYSNTMQSAAQATNIGDNGSKTTGCNATGCGTADPNNFYLADGADGSGKVFLMSITDAASAEQYGLDTASLARAGDDGSNRTFVAPNAAGLTAGATVMQPTSTKGVVQTNVSTTAPGAYPLTMLSYAAVTPASLSAANRKAYATFLAYAGGPGQTPGVTYGTLPPGYAPLPAALRAQTTAAASELENWGSAKPPASPSSSRPPASASGSGSPPSGSTPSLPSGTSSAGTATATTSAPAASSAATVRVRTTPSASRTGAGAGGATPNSAGSSQPGRQLASLAGHSQPTPALFIGAIKWVLPIALGVAVFAGLLGWQLSLRRGRGVRARKDAP
jgi:hypothetical protein